MTLIEIIQAAKLVNNKAFGNIEDKRALAIVRSVLGEVGKQINAAKADEKVALASFGAFLIKSKEVEKEGKKFTQRRVIFRPATAKLAKTGIATKQKAQG